MAGCEFSHPCKSLRQSRCYLIKSKSRESRDKTNHTYHNVSANCSLEKRSGLTSNESIIHTTNMHRTSRIYILASNVVTQGTMTQQILRVFHELKKAPGVAFTTQSRNENIHNNQKVTCTSIKTSAQEDCKYCTLVVPRGEPTLPGPCATFPMLRALDLKVDSKQEIALPQVQGQILFSVT